MTAHNTGDEILALPNAVWGALGQGYREDVYARSAAMGAKVCAKVVKACNSWGKYPERRGFENHRSFFQVPVGSGERSPGMSSGILALSVAPTTDAFKRPALFFHAIFLSATDYADVGGQAYGLWTRGAFASRWEGKASLPLIEVSATAVQPPPIPELQPGQAKALARELKHLLEGGSVRYTAFAPQVELSEHLRLLQLGLPLQLRQTLGFGVYLGEGGFVGGGGPFEIGAVPGPGSFQVGRSTLLPLHRPPYAAEAAIRGYVERYEHCLGHRALDELLELGRNHLTTGTENSDAKTRPAEK